MPKLAPNPRSATKVYVRPRSGFHPQEVAAQYPEHSFSPNEPGDSSRYGILTDETPFRHYAWEFLRRNRFFQQQQDRQSAGQQGEDDNIEWGFQPSQDRLPSTGLANLVHYSRDYISKPVKEKSLSKLIVVQWEIATDMLSRLRAPEGPGSRSVELEYEESQVSIIFDLVSLAPGTAAIDLQLEMARERLFALAAMRENFLPRRPSTPSRGKLRNLLRIVDLASCLEGRKIGDVSETYFKKYKSKHELQMADKQLTKKSREGHVGDLLDRAFEYVYGREYLQLLAFDPWPWIDLESDDQRQARETLQTAKKQQPRKN